MPHNVLRDSSDPYIVGTDGGPGIPISTLTQVLTVLDTIYLLHSHPSLAGGTSRCIKQSVRMRPRDIKVSL